MSRIPAARPLTIAITGHRPNRLAIGEARARQRIEAVLRALKAGARKGSARGPRVAVSALAEGADRIFAHAALALGYRLEVLLPFARADYATTFADKSAKADFLALLERAEGVRELPGSLAATKAAYEAVGQATVAACCVLVAVWDGRPAAGRGGTPEIIAYALRQGRPVIWIDAACDRPPRLLRRPTAHGMREVPLPALARRARTMTRRDIIAVGREISATCRNHIGGASSP